MACLFKTAWMDIFIAQTMSENSMNETPGAISDEDYEKMWHKKDYFANLLFITTAIRK